MTRDDLHALARAAQTAGTPPPPPPPGLDAAATIMWRTTVASLAALQPLGIDGEHALLDAYFEAHVDLLLAIVEERP